MDNQNLKKQKQKIDSLVSKVNLACGTEIEMQSHWAKYICVLCSGFLENAIFEIYSEFVKNAASKPVADYAESILSKVQNPKASKFVEITASFKKDWGTELENFLADNGRSEAINSIMGNRHKIAHGENSSITLANVKEYFEKSLEVVEFIEQQCKK